MDFGILRRLGLLWCTLCCLTGAMAFTVVPPGNVSGVWIPGNSPYLVKHGSISVPNGSSLIILAGVEVIFEGHHKFIVNGHLRAMGNATDSVVFKGLNEGVLNGWKGLRLIGADSTQFNYCVFENGNATLGDATDSTGGVAYISGSGSRVIFNHCTFRNNYAGSNGGALFVSTGTSAECYDCLFVHNESGADGGAAFVKSSTGSRFERCEFHLNRSGKEAGAIHSRFSTPVFLDCNFHHNTSYNSGGAVIASGQPSFRRCVFFRNTSLVSQGGGLYFYDRTTTATLDSCVVQENRTLLRDGGGIYCWESAPQFTDCQILNNSSADDGGGVHCYRPGANPAFTRCLFEGNVAEDTGGGIIISNEAIPTFTDCEFRGNSTNNGGGGGIYVRLQSRPVFTNCTIENNSARGIGGGVGSLESVPRLEGCLIRNNESFSMGGGIGALSTELTLTDCEVSNNHSRTHGGGIALTLATPSITRSRIQDNTADSLGGGLYFVEALPTLSNCLITGNRANVKAGAGYFSVSSPTFVHCTIADNTSPQGNVFVIVDSPGTMVNSIVARSGDNTGGGPLPGIGIVGGSIAWDIRSSLFYHIGTTQFVGTFAPGFGTIVATDHNGNVRDGYGNLFSAPGFVGSGIEPYLLSTSGMGSAALNTAPPFAANADLLEEVRPQPAGSLPDLGCFEMAQIGGDGAIAGEMSGAIESGVHRVFGDIVVPLNTTLDIESGAELEFMGPYAILVYGTLNVTGSAEDSVTMYSDTTENLLGWRGIRFYGPQSSGSALSYVTLAQAEAWPIDSSGGAFGFFGGASPVISRCEIRNCSAGLGGGARVLNGAPVFASCVFDRCGASDGGAVRLEPGAAVTLDSCSIENCSATFGGGGFSSEQGQLAATNTRFVSNIAADGGAMYLRNSSLAASYLTLELNSCSSNGGAIYASGATIDADSVSAQANVAGSGGVFFCTNNTRGEISGLLCSDNFASIAGGVMHALNGRVVVSQGLFMGNIAGQRGGAFSFVGDTSRVLRSTIVRNNATEGSAIYLENARVTVSSSQITDNGDALYFRSSASSRIEYSNFIRNDSNFRYHLNSPGNGPLNIGVLNNVNLLEHPSDSYNNIYVDPLYVDSENGEFAVIEGSDCLDAGNPSLSCDEDLTFPEIGAYFTPHTDNQWIPGDLTVRLADSTSVQLSWRRLKAPRLCNPAELLFVVEAQDVMGQWQEVYSTQDTTCTLVVPESATIVPLRVRSSVE